MFETDGYSALCNFLGKSTTAEVSHKFLRIKKQLSAINPPLQFYGTAEAEFWYKIIFRHTIGKRLNCSLQLLESHLLITTIWTMHGFFKNEINPDQLRVKFRLSLLG